MELKPFVAIENSDSNPSDISRLGLARIIARVILVLTELYIFLVVLISDLVPNPSSD